MIDFKLVRNVFSTLLESECFLSGIQIYEYSVVIVVDHLSIKAYTGLEVLSHNGDVVAWLDSDKTKRDLSSFYICSLVGVEVKALEVMEDCSIIISLDGGEKIIVPVLGSAESYEVSGEGSDIYII